MKADEKLIATLEAGADCDTATTLLVVPRDWTLEVMWREYRPLHTGLSWSQWLGLQGAREPTDEECEMWPEWPVLKAKSG